MYTNRMSKLVRSNTHLGRLQAQEACFVIEYVKDFSPRRAAEASGWAPDHGYELLKKEEVQDAISAILHERLDEVGIDASWLLYELVDNHRIARHQGNISASNTALKILAQLACIDAMASQRLDHMSSDKSISAVPYIDARMVKQISQDLEKEISFTSDKKLSFL